ncbi:HEAT repeat domain-containing protein [Methanospirillum sp.]|uniref:HEAT repeat domain-containing protein n=1 Tax=Methanospirillum sp. TaxID=45200 RepID=UPI00260FE326|nr:HEAT repeat domain-containing protein [Methanospirillum sp.]
MDLIERSASRNDGSHNNFDPFNGDFDAIISALGSVDETSREEAVLALSGLDDERVIYPLISALKDDSAYIRRSAADALGKSNSLKAVKPLIEALTDDDRYVRESASEGLGHIGKISMPDLIKGLSHPDWRVRMGIVIAFRVSPELPDMDPIIRLHSDDSIYVRREVVKTLGRIGDRTIFPYLVEATKDPDPGVRLRAVRAVARMGTIPEVT